MWKLRIINLILFTSIPVQSSEFSFPLPKLCRPEVNKLIAGLTKIKHWRRQSYAGFGTPAVFRTPTEKVGTWVETQIFTNKNANVLLLQMDRVTKYSWNPSDCSIQKTVSFRKYNETRLSKEYSDKILIEQMKGKTSGVIYAWSPHMPLSLAGIKPLREATQAMGLELTLVLDPHADKNISREIAKKQELGKSALKKLESVDLMYRGLGFHYPALVVYSKGRMNDFAIPGVKTSEEYEKLISIQIAALKEEK